MSCQNKVRFTYEEGKLSCPKCTDRCDETGYEVSLSWLKWPIHLQKSLQTTCEEILSLVRRRINGNDKTCQGPTKMDDYTDTNARLSYRFYSDLKACAEGDLTKDFRSYQEMAAFGVGSNLAEVFIYYRDFNYQSVVENEHFSFADLVAYLGGILGMKTNYLNFNSNFKSYFNQQGLFFGFTILTMFEYVQFIIELIIIACVKCCKKKNYRQVTPTTMSRNTSGAKPYPANMENNSDKI